MKKKIAIDMLLNIIATLIPTIVLQLILLPLLAGNMSKDDYGLLITIVALLNVVPSMMGNVLNNIRLINGKDESIHSVNDGYNIILLAMIVADLFIIGGCQIYYQNKVSVEDIILVVAVATLWLLREYYVVAFRIKLSYTKIVLTNLFLVVGYAFGYGAFILTGKWQFIYLVGNIVSLCYIFLNSSLYKEPLRFGANFTYLSRETAFLLVSGILNRFITYADKLLIFPILGGTQVSVYYAATILGKIVSLATSPISSVILSYLSKSKKQDTRRMFKYAVVIGGVVCIVGYLVCVLISRPILGIIYPQFVDEAIKYIPLTTISVVMIAYISVLNPFILKICKMKWQIVINGVTVLVYTGVSLLLAPKMELIGFCIGGIVAYATKIILMVLLFIFNRRDIIK